MPRGVAGYCRVAAGVAGSLPGRCRVRLPGCRGGARAQTTPRGRLPRFYIEVACRVVLEEPQLQPPIWRTRYERGGLEALEALNENVDLFILVRFAPVFSF